MLCMITCMVISRLDSDSTIAVLRFNITRVSRLQSSSKIRPLAEPVLTPLHGHFRVTWWDTEKLEWSTENQCETSTEGDVIVAKCQHLTDFTLIVVSRLLEAKLDYRNIMLSVRIISVMGGCLRSL
ncbi:Latrophilin/CL-1-like GPS domain protein [Cooperia oncophora]